MAKSARNEFDPRAFLAKVGDAKTVLTFHKNEIVLRLPLVDPHRTPATNEDAGQFDCGGITGLIRPARLIIEGDDRPRPLG